MNPKVLLFNSLLFFVLLCAWPLTGSAHAFLEHAKPGPGAELSAAPQEVALTYDRGVEAAFSTVLIKNENGHAVKTDKGQGDPGDPTTIRLKLPPMPPGTYRVFWSIMAYDGHRTVGDHTFTIRSDNPPAP